MYLKHPIRETHKGECGGVNRAEYGIYVPGIGTINGKDNSLYGGATGGGETGIDKKLEFASLGFGEVIRENRGMSNIERVDLDIFGFSRGAATARHFANATMAMGDPKIRIRFLGLFDTVGSFGIPGNDTQLPAGEELSLGVCNVILLRDRTDGMSCVELLDPQPLDLAIRPNTAETVFHITAEDEFRFNFPLSRAVPSHATEVSMPGAHGDVGGGYLPQVLIEDPITADRDLRDRGWFDAAEQQQVLLSRKDDLVSTRYARHVRPGLSDAPLVAMHARASRAGVPLQPLNVSMPADVARLAGSLTKGQTVDADTARRLRASYVHRSFGTGIAHFQHPLGRRSEYLNRP